MTTPAKQYDKRRLSYAGTFTNPWKAGSIRALEWATAKLKLLSLIRKFERQGAPTGQPFWPQGLKIMGIEVRTPPEEVAQIPKSGPLVVVANHPHGLVDGFILAHLVGQVRTDYKILTRSLLTGIPEIAEFLIPVPFPHEENARELGLAMREETMTHLAKGGCIILFPAGKVAASETWFGPAIEAEWNAFTAKMVTRAKATVVPIRFTGQNTRAYQIANKLSATLRQGLLLHEIKAALNKPQRPIIGAPITPDDWAERAKKPTEFLAWLREHTLSLRA